MAKLTKKDAIRTWFTWFMCAQAAYNYERMQGLGFLHAMCPSLGKLYKENEEGRKAAMERHMDFFNTEPFTGASIVGLSLAMEEEISEGKDIDPDAIRSLKTGMMGPLAGIGDSVVQGVVIPLLLIFAINFAMQGVVAAPIIYMLVTLVMTFGYSYFMFMLGYKKGHDAILSMLESGVIDKVINGASMLGCMVLGALVCNYVSLNCGIVIEQANGVYFNLQESLFDAILPGMLPLLLTMGCLWLLKKGKSTVWVLVFIIVLGAAGSALGIFA